MDQTPNEVTHLIDRLRAGDRQALGELFHCYRERLRRMVELRMDSRLRTRLDASDVLQEAYLDLARDLEAYRADTKLPPLLWMRLHVGRRLTMLHRRHLGTGMRDAGLEISLYREALPQASSAALASMLLGRHTSPTHSRSSAAPRRPRCWGSVRKRRPSGISAPSNGSKRFWRRCLVAGRGSEPCP
jgi:RNA polymerase sigma-70 factor (ECF subfamily)